MSAIAKTTTIADPNPSTRTMRTKALEIIGPHEIEVSEGVSVFVKEREIKILPLYRIRMVGYERSFDF